MIHFFENQSKQNCFLPYKRKTKFRLKTFQNLTGFFADSNKMKKSVLTVLIPSRHYGNALEH
jgi:hypothetical protein